MPALFASPECAAVLSEEVIEAEVGKKGAFAPLFRDYQLLFQATNPKATKAEIRKSVEASYKKFKDQVKDKKKNANNEVEEKNVEKKESGGVEEGEEMRVAEGDSFEASGEKPRLRFKVLHKMARRARKRWKRWRRRKRRKKWKRLEFHQGRKKRKRNRCMPIPWRWVLKMTRRK